MNKLKQFIRDAQRIALTKQDRSYIRATLVALTRASQTETAPASAGWFAWLRIPEPLFVHARFALVTACLVLVVIMTGGGIALAAESTLPGDILYPIKVKVTEELRTYLALTTAAKAEWETTRLERRLNEAEKLAAHTALNTNAVLTLEAHIDTHATRVEKLIEDLERENGGVAAATMSVRVEASLAAHQNILKRIVGTTINQVSAEESESLLQRVETRKKAAATLRASTEKKVKNAPAERVRAASEKREHAAKERLTEVRARIEQKKIGLGDKATTKLDIQLDDADKRMRQADEKARAQDFGAAFDLYQSADDLTRQTEVLLQAHGEQRINLDTLPMEAIITPTDEEDENKSDEAEEDRVKPKEHNNNKPAEPPQPQVPEHSPEPPRDTGIEIKLP